jgi:hypothetical protein
MLPRCHTEGEGFAVPHLDLRARDVKGFMEELQAFSLLVISFLIEGSWQDVYCLPRSNG